MKHLIICREYPPAPSGGIGTYAFNLSRLLAEAGETVHVIGQMWERAEQKIEERCHGRLIIHRVPFDDWASLLPRRPHPSLDSEEARGLFKSDFPPQSFSWQAGLLAEVLVEKEGIDIIEASDYEAPLYYFQLRRALGRGPKRQPPCLVHFHSPTEFIALSNDWDLSQPGVLTAKRLEDYSIAAADALLCPSRYLARQAEAHYGLTEGSVQVVPYPIGESRLLERDSSVWESGTICYVGRLERRKGVIEWVEAAVALAGEYPAARFEFVGDDTFDARGESVRELLESRIPRDLKRMFCFRDGRKRSTLPQFLARARMAVIPSRWENFPNTCIEAMGSGLPVIASREGGMAEMIEDGRTGWLANGPGGDGLRQALARALETPATRVREMGSNAALDIGHICNNGRVVERHLDLRSAIIRRGAGRSTQLPVNLPWSGRPLSDEASRCAPQDGSPDGLAIVIACADAGRSLDECLESLKRQTRKPAAVVVVDHGSTGKPTSKALETARSEGWQVIRQRGAGVAAAKNAGVKAVIRSGTAPLGFAFLSVEDRPHSDFIAVCEAALQQCPEVGLVSCWVHSKADNKVQVRPCPSFPYQWLSNEVAPFSAVRTEALLEAGSFRILINQGHEDWDLFNAVMAAGWVTVTVPEILVSHRQEASNGNGKPCRELLDRFPELIARDAGDLVLLAREASPMRGQIGRARAIMRHPRGPALRVLRALKNKIIRYGNGTGEK
jgi:glycosyltransferase involved in cell wall biosynthesis